MPSANVALGLLNPSGAAFASLIANAEIPSEEIHRKIRNNKVCMHLADDLNRGVAGQRPAVGVGAYKLAIVSF